MMHKINLLIDMLFPFGQVKNNDKIQHILDFIGQWLPYITYTVLSLIDVPHLIDALPFFRCETVHDIYLRRDAKMQQSRHYN